MFERLKKVFGAAATPAAPAPTLSRADSQQLLAWAQQRGYNFVEQPLRSHDGKSIGDGFVLDGTVQGKRWHLECGLPARDFVKGHELRARSELGLLNSVAVVVMNRPLKVALEKRAYDLYTDSLQTAVDSKLPDEMRWLAIYPEVGWLDMPERFFDRYAILSARREHASSWITPELASKLLNWPSDLYSTGTPFMMMLMNGKCYLRMQYANADPAIVQHAVGLFCQASELALERVAQAVNLDNT